MKILLPVLVLMGADMISMAEQTNSIAFYRERVQSIEAEARKNGAKDEVGFIDAYFVLGRKEAYVGFQKEMAASSEFILAHLDAIASTEYQKAIIAMSTWEMTRATFVTFLNAMADAVEANKIDRKFFKWAQSPTESHLSGLLVREYDKPDIQSIIVRSRKIFHDQPDLVAQYDCLLTGESRRKLEQFEAALREYRTTGSKGPQESTVQKSIVQDTAKSSGATETRENSASSVHQAEEEPVNAALIENNQPKKHKRGFALPVVVGAIAVLACVGVLLVRRHG